MLKAHMCNGVLLVLQCHKEWRKTGRGLNRALIRKQDSCSINRGRADCVPKSREPLRADFARFTNQCLDTRCVTCIRCMHQRSHSSGVHGSPHGRYMLF
eukprot:XP_001708008.1 Hypothetical protein GL50803_37055 [Giardia lamblia ATCC 50803]